MIDLFGHAAPVKPFRDIRNQRDSVAEEKAVLCMQLRELVTKAPPKVLSGSIQLTRQWVAAQAKAMKVLGSSRSTVPDLQTQVNTMRSYL